MDASGLAWLKQRWAARTSLATAALAVLLPLGSGGIGGILLLVAALAGVAVTAAAVWWVLTGAAWCGPRRQSGQRGEAAALLLSPDPEHPSHQAAKHAASSSAGRAPPVAEYHDG